MMAALAHSSLVDAPIDPAEAPMPAAAFQAIERATELCGHPPAVDLTAEAAKGTHVSDLSALEQRAEQALTEGQGCLIAHATKILRAQIRAGELLREMKRRGELSDLGEPTTDEVDPLVTDWAQAAANAWNAKGWKAAAVEYQVNRRNAYAWVRQ
jgi:hypothetical protein